MQPRRIFVTVGSQMPFDRLCQAVDQWVGRTAGVPLEVFAQIGVGAVQPEHMPHAATLPAADYEARVATADLVVAHAGTGTIFTTLRYGTPTLLLARRAALGETRNDHQEATAARFVERGLVDYAHSESDLPAWLDGWLRDGRCRPLERRAACKDHAEGALITRLVGFFDQHLGPASGGKRS